jgi:hypothetical protein
MNPAPSLYSNIKMYIIKTGNRLNRKRKLNKGEGAG